MNKRSNSNNKSTPENKPVDQKGQYCYIIGSFSGGFLALDNEFKIIFSSKETLNLLQPSTNQLIGKSFWELVADSPNLKWLSQYQNDVESTYVFVAKEFIAALNIWLEVKFSPSPDGFSVYLSDVTTHESMCETVEKEKLKFLRLFDRSPVPQWVYDIETLSFLEVNAAAISQYGYSRAEFLAMTIREIRPKSEQNVLQDLLKQRSVNGISSSLAAIHQLRNGENRNVKIESTAINFRGHNARLVLALDITQQYLAQEALANSEHRFKSLVQNGSDLIAILDHNWNYKYANDNTKTILNIDPLALIGKNAFDFINPEDKEDLLVQLKTLKEKKQVTLKPFRFTDGAGNYRWIATILTDMTDESSINGIIANSRDITEIIESKIKAQESIERYEIVAKATSDAIWDYDIATDTIIWNKAIQSIFGYKFTTCTSQWFKSNVHPDDLEETVIQTFTESLIHTKSKLMREFRFRCEDGSYKTVLDRTFIIYDSAKNATRMIGSMQDITHTNNYINAIKQQNKKLQEISWLQSHAVRAPLASVLGLTQLIQFPKYADEDLVQLLTYVKSSAEELDTVITNIIKKTYE